MKRCFWSLMMFVCGICAYAQTSSDIRPVVGVAQFTCETDSKYAGLVTEKVVEMLLPKNDARYNTVLTECYSYLGYYYMLQAKPEDYAISKEYWNKILGIDPNNALAKTALQGIEDMGQ